MAGVMKKGVVLLAVLFLLFYLINDPDGLADLATKAWGGVEWLAGAVNDLLKGLLEFVRALGS